MVLIINFYILFVSFYLFNKNIIFIIVIKIVIKIVIFFESFSGLEESKFYYYWLVGFYFFKIYVIIFVNGFVDKWWECFKW